MKQLVILSGKGGTGKTSLTAAFAHLASQSAYPIRAVLADADVDAANLELVLNPKRLETHSFTGGAVAIIDPERCQGCGICEQVCRFEAILPPSPLTTQGLSSAPHDHLPPQDNVYSVDPIACDGCAACVYQCPEDAIHMEPQIAGQWYRSQSRYGPLFHADLFPAQENSGKLVTLVKQNARLYAMDENYPVIFVDGPPGIGCPVIAAAAGADLALIVTEPSVAGIHDLQRALQTTAHFRIPTRVVINKADLYAAGTAKIKDICKEMHTDIVGEIPFDPAVTQAMLAGEPVTAYYPDTIASLEITHIWQHLVADLRNSD